MPAPTVLIQMWSELLEALKYVHSRGFSHGDIKPSNVCQASASASANTYLIDFGTLARFSNLPPKASADYPDPKDHIPYEAGTASGAGPTGTLPFASIDAHNFVKAVSRRGDLESLGYVMVEMFGRLPWAAETNFKRVAQAKAEYFPAAAENGLPAAKAAAGAKRLVAGSNLPASVAGVFTAYFTAVFKMAYAAQPDYAAIHASLAAAAKAQGTATKKAAAAKNPPAKSKKAAAKKAKPPEAEAEVVTVSDDSADEAGRPPRARRRVESESRPAQPRAPRPRPRKSRRRRPNAPKRPGLRRRRCSRTRATSLSAPRP